MKTNVIPVLVFAVTIIVLGVVRVPGAFAQSDQIIKQKIEDKVAETFSLRNLKVDIAVEDGYVVIFGEVKKYIQKMLYEKIAWKTTGVIEVDNEIRVVPRMKQTDAVIERKIMEVVQTYRRFQGAKIAVAVKAGAVHLRINLDHPSDVLFFKHRVAEIDGVVSIDIQAKFFA
jgi:osmotically-inducible protein OsmY